MRILLHENSGAGIEVTDHDSPLVAQEIAEGIERLPVGPVVFAVLTIHWWAPHHRTTFVRWSLAQWLATDTSE